MNINMPLYRGDEELELDIRFTVTPAEPSVGIGCCGVETHSASVYSKSERAWVGIDLTNDEWDKVNAWVQENYDV